MKIGTLLNGARGWDANQTIHADDATHAASMGYQFVVRYVRRKAAHDYDLTAQERDSILAAGLGLMAVQHVAPEGWVPTEAMGADYGGIAAIECQKIDLLAGVTVWCDLEGVQPGTPHDDVIRYCNAWHDAVAAAAFAPGQYVGWHCGLTPDELYHALHVPRYWLAYNLNAGEAPSVRGGQMRQSVAKSSDLLPGFTNQTMDTNTIHADALGGTPSLLLP